MQLILLIVFTCAWAHQCASETSRPRYGDRTSPQTRHPPSLQLLLEPKPIPYKVKYAHMKVSEGRYIGASDMGVQHCTLHVDGSAFGDSLGYADTFMLHVFLRYNTQGNVATVKGFVSTELINPLATRRGRDFGGELLFDPKLQLYIRDNTTAFQLAAKASFPVAQASTAVTEPVHASFEVVAGNEHTYYISSLGANSSCVFIPAMSPNVLDYRGVEVEVLQETAQPPKEAYIVMSPFYNIAQNSGNLERFNTAQIAQNIERYAVLLDRHIQWHKALGFSRHIVYLRTEDVWDFSENPTVDYWVRTGHLLLVLWQEIPSHRKLPFFDQHIVYNHAMLAFTGHNVYLAMMDLDEYVMSMRSDLPTFLDMAQECSLEVPEESTYGRGSASHLSPVNLQITRYHSRMKDYHRTGPESDVWLSQLGQTRHPLLRYSWVNRKRPPAVKSAVRPEFISSHFGHVASQLDDFHQTAPDPDCLFIMHLKNLFTKSQASEMSSTALRRAGYVQDAELEKALKQRGAGIESKWALHILPDHLVQMTV